MGGHRDSIIAALVAFLVLDGAAVAARVYVRTKLITRGFGLDDCALALTYLGYLFVCALGFTTIYFGYAATDEQPYYDARKAQQLTVYISSGLVKLAVALVLYRLAVAQRLRWLLIVSIFVVIAWSVITTLYASWLCAQGGSSNYAGSTTCSRVGYFRTISNIFIDYFYALLPIFMLRKVQMKIRLKALVVFLLGLGIFASSATIVKLVIIVRLTHAEDDEADGLHHDLLLWAIIELGLAIFAASCAALRPLLRHLPALWDSSRRTPRSHVSDRVGPYHELAIAGQMDRSQSHTGKTTPSSLQRSEEASRPSGTGTSSDNLV
ncbi:integral membrane protein [Biscogniauxia marginata]|nr:integral membrane protein [Biscogniauxia marginata]